MTPCRKGEGTQVPSPGTDRWLAACEVAEIMGVSLRTVYELCRRQGLRHARLTPTKNGVIRFRQAWLDSWLEERAEGGAR